MWIAYLSSHFHKHDFFGVVVNAGAEVNQQDMGKKGVQSFYLLSPIGIVAMTVIVLVFNLKSLFYGIETFLLLNYVYVYLPVFLYVIHAKSIRRKLGPILTRPRGHKYFVILVPAKNEALSLPTLLNSIQMLNYPDDKYKVVVVADNCTDNTADVARSMGAECIEKCVMDTHPGKGACLAYACAILQRQELPDDTYFIIADADCELERNYLREVNKKLHEPNAAPVLQSYRYVRNVNATAVASLDAASEMVRQLVMLGSRDAMGLNAFLHGSGTIFEKALFFAIANHEDESAGEDKEWNAQLLDQRIPIKWCPSARLAYQVYECNDEFQKQRVRWVRSQFINARKFAAKALWRGIRTGNLSQIDFACHLYQLPRSILIFLSLMCGMVNFFYFGAANWAYLWLLLAASSLPYNMLALHISQVQYSYKDLFSTGFKMVWGVARTSMFNSIGMKASKWWSDRRSIYNNTAK